VNLLVTGAGGFVGRSVVAAAIGRGHHVRALLRPASKSCPKEWAGNARIEIVHSDLRLRSDVPALLSGVNCVIHLAALKSGDLYEQLGGTVVATENLLDAMVSTDVNHLVLTSSLAVYEYLHRWSWSRLDEDSPLAFRPQDRDEYCQTKLFQERLVREYAAKHGWRLVVLRPGVIFGKDNLWSARLGAMVGSRCCMRIGSFASVPVTYVENCASAVVCAAEYVGPKRELVLNVVDDAAPSQRSYLRAIRAHMRPRPHVIPTPWLCWRLAARLTWLANVLLFGGRAKTPGILVPCRIHARCKPLRYCNEQAKTTLGWNPRFHWREGIAHATRENTEPDQVLKCQRCDEWSSSRARAR